MQLIAGPFQSARFEEHLDSARSIREVSTVLTLKTAQEGQAEATVHDGTGEIQHRFARTR